MCGQGFSGARYGDARNIVCCPVSGIAHDELLNGAPLLHEMSDFFIGNPDFQDMPKKFKFSISGCGCDCTRAITNDLAFVAVKKEANVGFTLLIGGGMGATKPGPQLAKPTDVFVESNDAFDVAVATIEIHRDYGSRESKATARFKWLLQHWGVRKFLDKLEEKLGKTLERYDGPVFIKNEGHEGIHPQYQEGYYFVNVPILGGGLTSDQMLSFANLADEYGNGELRLTAAQNLIIPNVEQKERLIQHLEKDGFSFDKSFLRWNSQGCASDYCGRTTFPHAKDICRDVVDHLEERFDAKALNEAGIRIHVSGCINNCCANLLADIGLSGRLNRKHGETKQNYDILLGGGFGTKSSLGIRIEENVPANKVAPKIETLLINYFQNKKLDETLKEFCANSNHEELKMYLNSIGG
jgi:sulfite reductase beta subunit-like hemoprotein